MSKDKNQGTLLPAKWEKLIKKMPEFKDIADAASVEDLKKMIITCEGHLYTINQDEEADVKLTAAKEMAKDLAAGYKEGRKVQQAKIQYSLFLLEGKGVDFESASKDE